MWYPEMALRAREVGDFPTPASAPAPVPVLAPAPTPTNAFAPVKLNIAEQ